jgi:hypothetical protein
MRLLLLLVSISAADAAVPRFIWRIPIAFQSTRSNGKVGTNGKVSVAPTFTPPANLSWPSVASGDWAGLDSSKWAALTN